MDALPNLAGITYTGAVNTRQLSGNLQVASGSPPTPFAHVLSPVSPESPFFYIYAGCVGDTINAFVSKFTFTVGGTTAGSPVSVVWGADAVYNAATQGAVSGLQITPFLGAPILFTHSQFAGACGFIIPNMGDSGGFISRWSAQADSVKIETSVIGAPANNTANAEYFHGIIQQPW